MKIKDDLEVLLKRDLDKFMSSSSNDCKQYTLFVDHDDEEKLKSIVHFAPSNVEKYAKLYGGDFERVVLRAEARELFLRKVGSGKYIVDSEFITQLEEAAGPVEEGQHSHAPQRSPSPPLNAEYILHLFLKADERDALIGDLLERYSGKCEHFGERRAKVWFYGEVLRSLWPLLKRLIARASGLIALGEWIRRHVS